MGEEGMGFAGGKRRIYAPRPGGSRGPRSSDLQLGPGHRHSPRTAPNEPTNSGPTHNLDADVWVQDARWTAVSDWDENECRFGYSVGSRR